MIFIKRLSRDEIENLMAVRRASIADLMRCRRNLKLRPLLKNT
jgi:hypothetical protein